MRPRLISLITALCLVTTLALGNNVTRPILLPHYTPQYYDQIITHLYQQPSLHSPRLEERLWAASGAFLNQPYVLGALGEGPNATFDQSPLYRTDAFDCLTFVSTTLALANAHNLNEFKMVLQQINYRNGVPNYVERNHFTSLDWNLANAKKGYLRDITPTIRDQQGHSVSVNATIAINKKAWYQQKSWSAIKQLQRLSPQQASARLQDLHQLSQQVTNSSVTIAYIPLVHLFDEHHQPRLFLLNQIPSGSIIELVTPHWDMRPTLGTFIDVAHLGWVFRTQRGLIFRDASAMHGKVGDTLLIPYLRQFLNSRTVKGINIQLPLTSE